MKLDLETSLPVDQQKRGPVLKADLTGKIAIVVGANCGIGFETAKHFALMGAKKVILACRDQAKGQAALEDIKNDTGYTKAEVWIVDLGDFKSVSAFAQRVNTELDRLDLFIANAAIAALSYRVSVHGYENTIQVNNLSTNLLSLLVLPKLVETATKFGVSPRLVIVSSDGHYIAPPFEPAQFESPEGFFKAMSEKEYFEKGAFQKRYDQSKVLNVLFFRELHSRLTGPAAKVTVNAVSPGYCTSGLRREVTGELLEKYQSMERQFGFTSEEGARHVVWAALALPDEEIRGQYTSVSEVREVSDYVLSPEGKKAQVIVWDDMVKILGDAEPKVRDVLAKYLQ